MEKQIREIIAQHVGGTYEAKQECAKEILRLFSVGRSEQLVCSCGSRLVKTTGGYHCGNAKCSV